MSRALATIDRISKVWPHPNADRLDMVQVRGWTCITGKGNFNEGDEVVYFEIDSALPLADERFAEYGERKSRKMETEDGLIDVHPLKTIRLRGEISQGTVMPLIEFPELAGKSGDVTTRLGIHKYEQFHGKRSNTGARMRGPQFTYGRPRFVPQTDAERVQNLPSDWVDRMNEGDWIATEKIHGTSTTFFYDVGNQFFGVCSRNLMLLDNHDQRWQVAKYGEWESLMRVHFPDAEKAVVIQGELAGEGLHGNMLGLKGRRFFPFRVMVDGKDVPSELWPRPIRMDAVPVIHMRRPESTEDALDMAASMVSRVNREAIPEGIVWRHNSGPSNGLPRCIKAINNEFLLNGGN